MSGAKTVWLFSYGSNDPAQLAARLRKTKFVMQPAWVDGYERVYRGWSEKWSGGTASLAPKKGKKTFGFVARVTAKDLGQLDQYEGVFHGIYERERITVMTPDGALHATVYIHTGREPSAPTLDYLKAVARTIGAFWTNPDGTKVTPADLSVSETPNPGRSVLDRAVRHYGLTEDWRAAGFILPDGSMLDFSEGSGRRTMDHRNVEFLVRHSEEEETRTETMRRFMRVTGAVRLMPERPYFEVRTHPTRAQTARIVEIAHDAGEAELDMDRHRVERFSREYEDWNVRELRRDVEAYWTS